MSIRAQIAFGKNYTLQKQLEDKYLNLRRMFKHSRRRLDTMEEECVATLYKLLLYAKEKQGLTDAGDISVFKDPFTKPKSAASQRSKSVADVHIPDISDIPRPATAMSAKAYTQSFSFIKDGLNIEKTRRDRFMRTKAEREKDKENKIKVERLTDDWQMIKENNSKTPAGIGSLQDELLDNDHNKELSARPKTAYPQGSRKSEIKGILSRPRTSNALRLSQGASTPTIRTTSVTDFDLSRADSPTEYTYTEEVHEHNHYTGSTTNADRSLSPRLKTVHESRTRIDGTKSPLVVRITTTHPQEAHQGEQLKDKASRHSSMSNSSDDEDLIPLGEEDKHTLKKLTNDDQKDANKLRKSPYGHGPTSSRQALSRNDTSSFIPDNSILRKSTQKTQSFLTQYSKKSKVIGYVMKTRSSNTAPRERLISHRSPCITYQELMSIKAGIKQHESKSRSLIQRSAKLSTYVDKLAKAGEMRKRLQEFKEGKME